MIPEDSVTTVATSEEDAPELEGDGLVPACTPAMGLIQGPFEGNGGNHEYNMIESSQMRSLQRRFVTQQTLDNFPAGGRDNIEPDVDTDGFILHSQPTYERVISQRMPGDVEGVSIDENVGLVSGIGHIADLDTIGLPDGENISQHDVAEALPSEERMMNRVSENKDDEEEEEPTTNKCTPAVHSADRIQLNSEIGTSYFPIFRSKKDCKVVYIIRHGESEFNAACSARGSSWEDPCIFDARLTARGRAQAMELRKHVSTWGLPDDVHWITSPLTRAIETLLHVHPQVSHPRSHGRVLSNVTVLPEVSERLATSGDIGRKPADLCKEFPMLGDQLSKLSEVWWFTKEDKVNCPYKLAFQAHEPKDNVYKRITAFKTWLIKRPEKYFVAVGHSMFWRDFATSCNNGVKQDMMRNCEWQVVHV